MMPDTSKAAVCLSMIGCAILIFPTENAGLSEFSRVLGGRNSRDTHSLLRWGHPRVPILGLSRRRDIFFVLRPYYHSCLRSS